MPLRGVEDLRGVRRLVHKVYGIFGESVQDAHWVTIALEEKGKSHKPKERLLVVCRYRLLVLKEQSRSVLTKVSSLASSSSGDKKGKKTVKFLLEADHHLYDLIFVKAPQPSSCSFRFQQRQQTTRTSAVINASNELAPIAVAAFAQTVFRVQSERVPQILLAVRRSYGAITIGYDDEMLCTFDMCEKNSLPLDDGGPDALRVAGGLWDAYQAQCCYFGVPISDDVGYLIHQMDEHSERELDLSECPIIEAAGASPLRPLIGAMRHNVYILGLRIVESTCDSKLLRMLSVMLKHNSTLTKLVLRDLGGNQSGLVEITEMLSMNLRHKIQVLDLSHNILNIKAMIFLGQAFKQYRHALTSLSLRNCGLTKECLATLFQAFTGNYPMSLTIERLDLSQNHLGVRGTRWLSHWLNMTRDHTHLRHLHLAKTALKYVFLGKHLIQHAYLDTLDISGNVLSFGASQLLTQFVDTAQTLKRLDVTGCQIGNEQATKLLISIGRNEYISNVQLFLGGNALEKAKDSEFFIDALKQCSSKLNTLSLADNPFSSSTLTAILQVLVKFPVLQMLVLDRAYDTSLLSEANETVALTLGHLVTRNMALEALSIVSSFGPCIESFMDSVRGSPSLAELDISRNGVGDSGAGAVAIALRTNRGLRYLAMDKNGVQLSGFQAILQGLNTNHSLLCYPFPWSDYHKCYSELPDRRRPHLRRLLTEIQQRLSSNTAGYDSGSDYDDDYEDTDEDLVWRNENLPRNLLLRAVDPREQGRRLPYRLLYKQLHTIEDSAPETVFPTATAVDMPEDVGILTEFTFEGDSDEEATEIEYARLVKAAKKAPTSVSPPRGRAAKAPSQREQQPPHQQPYSSTLTPSQPTAPSVSSVPKQRLNTMSAQTPPLPGVTGPPPVVTGPPPPPRDAPLHSSSAIVLPLSSHPVTPSPSLSRRGPPLPERTDDEIVATANPPIPHREDEGTAKTKDNSLARHSTASIPGSIGEMLVQMDTLAGDGEVSDTPMARMLAARRQSIWNSDDEDDDEMGMDTVDEIGSDYEDSDLEDW